jgi:hypothetical protein
MNKTIKYILLLTIGIGILTLFLASSFFAELNQDEGWYLYAARLVSQGQKPFVDFAYTQGPVMCYVYSLFTPIINDGGIFAGRIITAILGITATILCACFSAQCVKKEHRFNAFIIALALCGLNMFYINFCTIVKTYALCACFIMSGLIFITFLKENNKKNILFLLLSGMFFGLATSVRISAGVALPIIFFGLLIKEIRSNKKTLVSLQQPLYFAIGAAITGALVFLPLYIKSPDSFMFFVFEYHAARAVPALFTMIAYKIGFLSRFFAGTLIVSILIVTAIVIKLTKLKEDYANKNFAFTIACITFAGISLLHFAAAFPYDDYQIIIYPLMTSIATIAIINILSKKQVNAFTYNILIVTVIFTLASPKLQEWFIVRDRIWWPIKEEYPLQTLKKAANTINELKTNNLLLTQDAYLAIETGMDLPDNMALGPFSYYPDMPTEKAEKFHVLNKEMLVETLKNTDASVAAISEYGFAIECPDVSPISVAERNSFLDVIKRRYEHKNTIPNFGQAYTELELYKLKKETWTK